MIDYSKNPKFEKTNHHYVPQFWQKQFQDADKNLFKTDRGKYVQCSTRSTMTQDLTYLSFDNAYRPTDTVEDALSKIEGKASVFIERVIPVGTTMGDEDWAFLCDWLSISACRHPNVLRRYKPLSVTYGYTLATAHEYQSVHQFNEALYRQHAIRISEAHYEALREVSASELLDQAIDAENMPSYDPRLPQNEALNAWEMVAQILAEMDLILLDAPDGHEFLLGDNPLPNKDLRHGFSVPLGRFTTIRARPATGDDKPSRVRKKATVLDVFEINTEQIGRSTQAIASSKSILKYWVELFDAS